MRQSFSERMAEAKDLAQDRRNRGQHTGKSAQGWNYKRHYENRDDYRINKLFAETYRLEALFDNWRKDWQQSVVAALDIELNGEPYADEIPF